MRIKSIKEHIGNLGVYDIAVDGNYHNFKLSNNIFVHNSGFHTLPKKSDVKKMYCSAWYSNSNRDFESSSIPGYRYKPLSFPNNINGGGLILYGDYSNLEVRVLAAITRCIGLRDLFLSGEDIHSSVAKRIFNLECDVKDIKKYYDDLRSASKAVTFGIVYGKTAVSLASDLNITLEKAQEYLDFWFQGFPEIKEWIDRQHELARNEGYTLDIFNGIRWIPDAMLPDIRENSKRVRHAMNVSQNSCIQSSASRAAFIAAADMQNGFSEASLKSIMAGGVHDSILNDIYPGELYDVLRVVRKYAMEVPQERYKDWLFGVPLVFDMAIGVSWGRALEIEKYNIRDDGVMELELTGGNVDFKLLKRELDIGYKDKHNVADYQELDEISKNNNFIELSDKLICAKIELWR